MKNQTLHQTPPSDTPKKPQTNTISFLQNIYPCKWCSNLGGFWNLKDYKFVFQEWVVTWNEDKQEYLLLRLKDLDSTFYTKYQEYLDNVENPQDKVKDFFEPGVPPELGKAI